MSRKLRTLDRHNPTPNNGTWEEFLGRESVEEYEVVDGVRFLRSSINHVWIIFPNNVLVCTYGTDGYRISYDIGQMGWREAMARMIKGRREILALRRLYKRPKEFEEAGRDEIYTDQVRVNASTNGKTVTDHVLLTRGRWWVSGMGVMAMCIQVKPEKVPEGLPVTDETTPIGSPFCIETPAAQPVGP